ncbi:MAG: ADP-ribosylglycohydrolase family protein [Anaerolineae bacterium]|nr:ADP-ribosylglycohydrolase family protein [Anaerolineae bacterium]
MLGAVIGDVIGSVFENQNTKTYDFDLFNRFSRFTDDTVLTVAIGDAVLHRQRHPRRLLDTWRARDLYAQYLKQYGKRYPHAGYGAMFTRWLDSTRLRGYGSYGNGSAMRVSPIGWAFDDLNDVLREAKLSAEVTHNHRQGIRGAQAIASAVYLAKQGASKVKIKTFISRRFGYDLTQRLDDLRPTYTFDSSCQGSVPQAIIAFLESSDFEDAIRKAISLGGDSDTLACMAGAIAHAFYREIPPAIVSRVRLLLTQDLKHVIDQFYARFEC